MGDNIFDNSAPPTAQYCFYYVVLIQLEGGMPVSPHWEARLSGSAEPEAQALKLKARLK